MSKKDYWLGGLYFFIIFVILLYIVYLSFAGITMLPYDKINTECKIYDKYKYINNGNEIVLNYDKPGYKILYSSKDNYDSLYMSINNCVPKHCITTYEGFMLPEHYEYRTTCFKKGL